MNIAKNIILIIVMATTTLAYSQKKSDEILLASLINAECGICPMWEQKMVGWVVLNRVNDPDFPNNIHDVIMEKGQFDGIYSPHFAPTRESINIAREVLYWGPQDDEERSIIFFNRKDIPKPMWTGFEVYSMKYHAFYTKVLYK